MTKKKEKFEVGQEIYYFDSSLPKMKLNKCVVQEVELDDFDRRFKLYNYTLEDIHTKEIFKIHCINCAIHKFTSKEKAIEEFLHYINLALERYQSLIVKFPKNINKKEWEEILFYYQELATLYQGD